MNAFFAVVMGLSNMACSRLSQSWDKLPSKFRKLFAEFEALIDPSRNHRAYRFCFRNYIALYKIIKYIFIYLFVQSICGKTSTAGCTIYAAAAEGYDFRT